MSWVVHGHRAAVPAVKPDEVVCTPLRAGRATRQDRRASEPVEVAVKLGLDHWAKVCAHSVPETVTNRTTDAAFVKAAQLHFSKEQA